MEKRAQSLCLIWQRYFGSCGGEEDRDVDTSEFVQIVSNHKEAASNLRLIDVREPEELVESGQIPGAINIPRKRMIGFFLVASYIPISSWRS